MTDSGRDTNGKTDTQVNTDVWRMVSSCRSTGSFVRHKEGGKHTGNSPTVKENALYVGEDHNRRSRNNPPIMSKVSLFGFA